MNIIGMILIDLQKTFEKMLCLGLQISVIKWFESYLSSREFLVSPNDILTEAGTLSCGAYSGTTPVLVYTNHLVQPLLGSGSYLYADDTYFLS